jgi:outer membrane protein OmpA-like peptidoglycan-associated protein
MNKKLTTTALAVVLGGAAWASPAAAEDLMALSGGDLRSALQQRYDTALAATQDPGFVSASDSRFTWASEAKVQCGIALGYLKSNTRDDVSISKCELASRLMQQTSAPVPPPPPPSSVATVPAEVCSQKVPGIVFFEFDSAEITSEARQTVEYVAKNAEACNWQAFDLVGHTDRAGSDPYNMGLSTRRADSVAALMASMGIASSQITTEARGESEPRVPTADGVRNPQNRRVEISVK